MSITTVLFDLDGTLLPMDQDIFVKAYLGRLAKKMVPYGYEPQELVKVIWAGTSAMVKNEGHSSNMEVFWEVFSRFYGDRATEHRPIIDAFYLNEFAEVRPSCGFNPKAAETVRAIKDLGLTVGLATNPIFPAVATHTRLRWTGMEPEEFAICTTYENSCHCKPNPDYYRDILNELKVKPEECLMVGNDAREDLVAETLGMKVFLLTDCLILHDITDVSRHPQGSFPELLAYIHELLG